MQGKCQGGLWKGCWAGPEDPAALQPKGVLQSRAVGLSLAEGHTCSSQCVESTTNFLYIHLTGCCMGCGNALIGLHVARRPQGETHGTRATGLSWELGREAVAA